MAKIITDEEVFVTAREAIVFALAVEPEQVTPDTKLLDDLGAESIDFLDIAFRLEQMLPIRIPRDDLIEQLEEALGEETVVDADRQLTPLGAYLVRERLTGIDSDRVQPGLCVDDVARLWTVQTWADLAMRLLDTIPDKCPHCGNDPGVTRDENGAYRVSCSSCQGRISSIPGDRLNQQWLEAEREKPAVQDLLARSPASESAPVGGDPHDT
jgi:acyl carrier protein